MNKDTSHGSESTGESNFGGNFSSLVNKIDSVIQNPKNTNFIYGYVISDDSINLRLGHDVLYEVTCYQQVPGQLGGEKVQFTEVFDNSGKLAELRLGVGVGVNHKVDYRIDPINLKIENLALKQHTGKQGNRLYSFAETTIDINNSQELEDLVGKFTMYCALSSPITYYQALGHGK